MTERPVPYFLARPAAPPPWPGVVVLMEGLGITPQLLRLCERLATEGYAAIAPDLYHRSGGGDPERFIEHFRQLRDENALADIGDAAAELRRAGASSVGVTGFCMGGRLTYLAAVSGLDVAAAAGFYGAGTSSLLGKPACPVLLLFGGNDPYIPPEDIERVRSHHPDDTVVYQDAGHGFMRDGSEAYDEAAASDAWKRLLAFFGEHLR